MDFLEVYLTTFEQLERFWKPNLDELNISYGRLGNYIHAQNVPEDSIGNGEWWQLFFDIVSQAESILHQGSEKITGNIQLSDHEWELFNQWNEDEISDEEVITIVHDEMTEFLRSNGDDRELKEAFDSIFK